MHELERVAPAFVEMAHRIVWCTAATVDTRGRPRTRVLHPIWDWDGSGLTGWIATDPTSPKRRHLDRTPALSLTYWTPDHDTCTAECEASWLDGASDREALWERFRTAPPPVGYDPRIVPGWDSPAAERFGVLRLEPRALRLMPGSLMLRGEGELLTWRAEQ